MMKIYKTNSHSENIRQKYVNIFFVTNLKSPYKMIGRRKENR